MRNMSEVSDARIVVADLFDRGPHVREHDRVALGVVPERLGVKSMSIVPASAYATTSGGEAR